MWPNSLYWDINVKYNCKRFGFPSKVFQSELKLFQANCFDFGNDLKSFSKECVRVL